MNLQFNILWIDDRRDAIEPIEDSIRDYLEEHGFLLEVIYRARINEESLRKLINNNEIDLVAMDYILGSKRGDELLKIVKQEDRFIESVLYSQEPHRLKDKIRSLEGVYVAHRSDVKGVLKNIIERLIKKSLDLNIFRGLVIAETIDIENQLDSIIQKSFRNKGQLLRDEVIDKHFLDFGKKVAMINSLIKHAIRSKKLSADTVAERTFKEIEKDVLDCRNILAHSKVRTNSDGTIYLKGLNKRTKEIKPTNSWKIEQRKTLLKHSKNLEHLIKILK